MNTNTKKRFKIFPVAVRVEGGPAVFETTMPSFPDWVSPSHCAGPAPRRAVRDAVPVITSDNITNIKSIRLDFERLM
jgi:hypothetical protein